MRAKTLIPTVREEDHVTEGRDKLLRALDDSRRAVHLCLDDQLWLPALILVYALLDALAWVGKRGGSQPDVTRDDFIRWCDRYLLVPPSATFSAVDLYAARCGLVHSNTAESRLMRQGQARPVWYDLPTGQSLVPIRTVSSQMPVIIPVQGLVDAVFRAAESLFVAAVDADRELAREVWARANVYYDVGTLSADAADGRKRPRTGREHQPGGDA